MPTMKPAMAGEDGADDHGHQQAETADGDDVLQS